MFLQYNKKHKIFFGIFTLGIRFPYKIVFTEESKTNIHIDKHQNLLVSTYIFKNISKTYRCYT